MEELLKGKEEGADVHFLSQLGQRIIMNALHALPEEQREAIIRSYFKGETHSEIAEKMNKPLGTVKSMIRYGLNNLRKQKSLIHWVESGAKRNNDQHE